MALSNLQDIAGQQYYSCDFPDLLLQTDAPYIGFTLAVNGTTVLSTRYFPYDGKVTIRNLASCVEAYMQQDGVVYTTISITIAIGQPEDEYGNRAPDIIQNYTAQVMYCRDRILSIPASDFRNGHFFTTNTSRLTTIYSQEQLYIYLQQSNAYNILNRRVIATIRLEDDTVVDQEVMDVKRVGGGIHMIDVSPRLLHEEVMQYVHRRFTLLAYTVEVGTRRCRFYVMPCTSAEVFRFVNNFGCEEYISIPYATTSKLKTDFSEAVMNGITSHYDVRHQRSYEMETPALLSSQQTWMEQFLTSPKIEKLVDGTYHDVLITEYDFEQSDAPGAENVLKFSWQFASDRQTNHELRLHTGIFTEPFNQMYA